MLKIIPLGGTREIGLNMMVIEYNNVAFAIDAGLMFPEGYMLGVDIVIPEMDYVREKHSDFAAIVLTHAHEDHIGALPFLLRDVNVPVFGTAFTLELVKHKLEEVGLLSAARLHEISPDEMLRIGPFELDFIRVNHSVVDGVGIAIKTPAGTIIHTGDFKFSDSPFAWMNTDVNKFAWYGRNGVLALMSDSTNVEKEGYTISDKKVGETLEKIIAQSNGRAIIALFASNIVRIQQIVDIAARTNRKIAFDGKSIEMSTQIAKGLNYLRMPEKIEINIRNTEDFPDDEVIVVTTGSQGEPMSSLARMATGRNKLIKTKKGDTIILSSKFIPGNEKAIANIINLFYEQEADVVYEKISDIHVSGHAFREELKQMIKLVKPDYFIPIHGERRHLVLHTRLAHSIGIPESKTILPDNGQIIEFSPHGPRMGGHVETGRVMVDGKGVGDVGSSVLRERKELAEDGLVIVTMVFDEETGIVIYGPELTSKGFVFFNVTGHLLEDAQCVILEIVEEVTPDIPDRVAVIESRMKTALRQYFKFTIKRRPVVIPVIIEV
ncbi:MAG: ribonuclease J [Thermodesulfobacteriota bacterium]|nr:ribonuclease J [Thermodesulfobacteriota bacterium]